MGQIWSAIVNKWNEITGWLGGVGGRILGAIGNLGGILVNAGRQVIDGFLNGLKGMWNEVQGWFNKLTSMIPKWKGPEKRDKKLLTNAGQLILGGFLNGLESMYGKVRKSLTGFTDDLSTGTEFGVKPVLGGFDPGNLLGDAGLSQNAQVLANASATNVLNETPTAITYDVRELNVNNPRPERTSESLPRAVRRLGYVGVGGNA
jgi:phage-related protein